MLSAFIRSIGGYPAVQLALQPVYRSYVHPGPCVLGTDPFKLPTPTTDRDQTVSRRFEQPNPWKVLPLQDVMSRHRGAKPRRRSELLDAISLLSPG